jgi:hypothetical protein
MADLPDGVPALLSNQNASFLSLTTLLTADTFIGYGLGEEPQWGVFLGGAPVITADTVTTFGYQQDWAVSDYPIEGGGFESYDKVNVPFRTEVQFTSGGSLANREALLASIAAIADTLTLYDVVTPEAVYSSVNVEHYNYRRTSSNGLGLMVVTVGLLEIRVDNTTNSFQNTFSPASFSPAPAGNVQATQTQITVQPPPGGFGAGN